MPCASFARVFAVHGRDHEQVGAGQVRIDVVAPAVAVRARGSLLGHEALCPGVTSGTTSWPALTSRRVTSHAL